jgi:hypothetical protein
MIHKIFNRDTAITLHNLTATSWIGEKKLTLYEIHKDDKIKTE